MKIMENKELTTIPLMPPSPINGNQLPIKQQKYTVEYVKEELNALIEEVRKDPDILYMGELLEKRNYPAEYISWWRRKHSTSKGVIKLISKLNNMLESRVNVAGLKGKANPSLVKFNLINNYGWKDTQVQQNVFINEIEKTKSDLKKAVDLVKDIKEIQGNVNQN